METRCGGERRTNTKKSNVKVIALLLILVFITFILSDRTAEALTASLVGSLPNGINKGTAVAVSGSNIYIFGGLISDPTVSDAILMFDPNQNSVTQIGKLPQPLFRASSAKGGEGNIYIFGGWSDRNLYRDTIYSFDPVSKNVTTLAVKLPSSRESPMAVSLPDGNIVIVGGNDAGTVFNDVLIFNPSNGTISQVATLPKGISRGSAALGSDGKVYIFGGINDMRPTRSSEIYSFDPQTKSVTKIGDLPYPIVLSAAVSCNASIYVLGGNTSSGDISTIYEFDINTRTITLAGQLDSAVSGLSAAFVPSIWSAYYFYGPIGKITGFPNSSSPSAPQGLIANAMSSTSVSLTWQPNTEPDLAGYYIYRNGSQIAQVGPTTSYTDNTVLPGTNYTYNITAYNTSNQQSGMSPPATVTTPPAAPTNLIATVSGKNISLTWQGFGYADYIVQRSTDGISFTQVAEVTQTSFTETAPLWGTTYYYRVAQKGQDGAVSDFSEPVQVTTDPVPPAPEAPRITYIVDNTNVELAWNYQRNCDGYRVYINGSLVAELESNKTNYIFTGERGKSYTVKVEAYNAYGQASSSVTVNISEMPMPGVGTMAGDVLKYSSAVLISSGGLLALALALKGSGGLMAIIRMLLGR